MVAIWPHFRNTLGEFFKHKYQFAAAERLAVGERTINQPRIDLMPAHRTVLSLARGLLVLLPMVSWVGSAPAQQQPYGSPYPPPRDDAYRPPYNSSPPYYPREQQPYYPPGPNTYSGPGQPYGPPPTPNDDRYYGPQSRYDDRYHRPYGPQPYRDEYRDNTYSSNEIVAAGHQFFGTVTQGLARVIEYAFQKQGRPNGYILGQDAGGAFIAGLRYGEGTLYTKDAGHHRVYWQGPSIGYDAGGDGSKVMVLVYNLSDPSDIYRRFGGVDGSAYVVGGVGLTFQKNGDVVTAPIRTGVGLRLGANIGYLKYTRAPTWNPF